MYDPTAQRLEELTAATLLSLFSPPTFGLETTCQVVPFQCSISTWPTSFRFAYVPTAQMLVALTAATPLSPLSVAPGLGTGDDLPGRAIPMFNQRLARTDCRSRVPTVQMLLALTAATPLRELPAVPNVRAGDHLPGRAIPVFNQRLGGALLFLIISHGPDVRGTHRGHSTQRVATIPHVGAGNHLPVRAIPVFNQRLADTALVRIVPTAQMLVELTAATPVRHCRLSPDRDWRRPASSCHSNVQSTCGQDLAVFDSVPPPRCWSN